MAESAGKKVSVAEREIGIMVCGKTGIGKSSLLNILLGTRDIFKVKGPGKGGLDGATQCVEFVSKNIHGVKVTMYDTPGIELNQKDDGIVKSIKKITEKIDLVLFCVDGTVTRWETEKDTVTKLHSCFESELWTKAIFVLTRSNMAQHALIEDEELSQDRKSVMCEKAANDIFERFKEQLRELKVSAEVVKRMPLIAAGTKTKRRLWFVAPQIYNEDFLPELWTKAVRQCREQKKELFIHVSNYNQIRFILQNNTASLSPTIQANLEHLYQDLQRFNDSDSSLLSEENEGTMQPSPIVLNERQSLEIFESLMGISHISAVVGGLVAAVSGGIAEGMAAGSTAYFVANAIATGGALGAVIGTTGLFLLPAGLLTVLVGHEIYSRMTR